MYGRALAFQIKGNKWSGIPESHGKWLLSRVKPVSKGEIK
jgi:hypothetical protein